MSDLYPPAPEPAASTQPKAGWWAFPQPLAVALLVLCAGLGQLLQLTLSPATDGYLGIVLGLTMGAVPAVAIFLLHGKRD